jgi:hypothetical protein
MKRVKLDESEPTAVGTQVARGAPSKYDAKLFPKTAKFLDARGATQDEIAECFGVSTRTLQRWLAQYPELYAAIQQGNDVFNPRVERALAERAIGFWVTWEEEELHPITGEKILVKKHKYFPPDTKAGIFWTTNRMPDKWRRVQKHEVEVKRRSPDEILEGIHAKLLDLQAKGYLDAIPLKALPASEEE